MFIQLLRLAIIFFLTLPFLFFILDNNSESQKLSSTSSVLPKRCPVIGSYLALKSNLGNRVQWITQIFQNCHYATYTLHLVLGSCKVLTANPDNVHHILKSNFNNYPKGPFFITAFFDFLGNDIFNVDRESWKFERQVSNHEFNTKSLRKFVETVIDTELHDRLVPMPFPAIKCLTCKMFFRDLLSTTFAGSLSGMTRSAFYLLYRKPYLQMRLKTLLI
ncbi:hypothetical protein GQ457_13G021580 [Hibiscus cannabinus]